MAPLPASPAPHETVDAEGKGDAEGTRGAASKTPRRLRKTLFSVLVAVLALAILEGAARRVLLALGKPPTTGIRFERSDVWEHEVNAFVRKDADLLWRTVPGYAQGSLRVNSRGFRGPELAVPKPRGTFRIVLLGDSVTFGFNVTEEDSYASRLREYVNDAANRYPAQGHAIAEVVNAGVPGYSSWQGRNLYEQAVQECEPDLVICSFGYNDHHSAVVEDRAKQRSNPIAALVRESGVFRLTQRLSGPDDPELESRPVPRVDVADFRQNVLAINDAAERDGARVLFLTVPLRRGIPMVENFRAVSHDGDRSWQRQLDFVVDQLDEQWRKIVTDHFLRSGGIRSFAKDARNLERLVALTREHPDLPAFHYLLARCRRAAGDEPGAAAAMGESRRQDHERREMEAYNDTLRSIAEAGLVEVIDIALRLTPDGTSDRGLFHDVVHPTPVGHDRMARIIADYLHDHP